MDTTFLQVTITGRSYPEFRENFQKAGETFDFVVTDKAKSNGVDTDQDAVLTKQKDDPRAAVKGRRQAKDKDLSVTEKREQAVDILKKCYGKKPDGAEKVIALQNKMKVKRFAEVPDEKIDTLLTAALALEEALSGKAPAADDNNGDDTGPF